MYLIVLPKPSMMKLLWIYSKSLPAISSVVPVMPKVHLLEVFIAIILALLQNSLSAKNNADINAHAINVYSNYACAANKLFVSLIIIL